ncbi:MAG TPA: site-specific integrase [Chitinophagales bacterium]|nr:site-specific integrase [Chitinophagales bacterium]HPA35370.1 site-specific integrase [Chitinophagales bacterium]HQO31828.1 site-specific integrase [Chitinophagales bacterium]HQO90074.1 site-specific integrase [Chitinophagales bacterium]
MAARVSYELDVHEGKDVILIKFPYDKELVERVKKLVGVKWSQSKKAWYVLDTSQYRKKFGIEEKVIGKEAITRIHEINKSNFQNYVDLLYLKGYSTNTIRTYTVEFSQLLYLLKEKNINELTTEQLKSYLLYCLQTLKLSENQVHNRINAIKFYFEKVLKRPTIVFEIPRPKKPLLLPKVIHIEDVAKMIKQTQNIKHKTMLMLVYGMGLRVSEIVKLEITDIDSKNMQVHIRGAKGKKDRYANLPETVLPFLRNYYKAYKPKKYLFEGQYGEQYSRRSAQQVFKQSLERANINKNIGIHGLRHSFATHLLEQGTDISYIQKLLGHNNIKTTLIYAHVGKKDVKAIKSPIDQIKW